MKKLARYGLLIGGTLLIPNACTTGSHDTIHTTQTDPLTTQSPSVTAFDAYNAAFLVRNNGQTYYAEALASVSTKPQGEWQQALDIFVAEDAYEHTRSDANRNLVIALLDSLAYFNAPASLFGNWKTDGWNDNLAWMVNAFLRGYQLTGIPSYLTEAEAGWNNGYKGWFTSVAGGGIWENSDKQSKCGLSNHPFVFEGVQLYLATQDATYLTKAETIYAWAREHLVNTTSSSNSLGAPGQVNGCVGSNGVLQSLSDNVYDSGAFVKAAADLYRVTGNAMYFDDAVRSIDHIVGEGPVMHNGGEAGHQWAYWFTRGLSDFATETNLWPKYQSWLQGNADAAWSKRSSANITWNDWRNPTNDSGSEPNEMSSAAAIWQHLPPPGINLAGTWEIQNAGSGLALTVSGASTANGAAITQHPFTNGATNALWTFVPTSGGYYHIKNVNSGQVVNVQGGSGLSGAPIVQWPAQQSMLPGNDQWLPVQNTDGTYSFYNLNSLQALDDPHESTDSDTPMDQWFGNGTSAQRWKLSLAGTSGVNGTVYNFGALAHPGSCLDALGAGTTDGTPLEEYSCNGTGAQSFAVVGAANGAVNIVNTNANKCVDINGGGTANGTAVQLWDCNGLSSQTFILQPAASGFVNIINTNSNKCLDVQGGNPNDGTTVQLYDCNGTSAQLWNPTAIGVIPGGGGPGVDASAPAYMPCPSAGPCVIMPVGDSITAGANSTTGGGYRLQLLTRLRAANHNATFVGDNLSGPTTLNGQPFPQANEGFSGYTIDDAPNLPASIGGPRKGVAPLMPAALAKYSPNIVLLMIGTNDVGTRNDLAGLPTRLANMVDVILADHPNALLLVAQILPLGGPADTADNSLAQAYNAAIVGLVQSRASAGKHIATVDMYSAMTAIPSYDTQLMNGLHPNDKGYVVVGNAWYNGLAPYL